MSWRVRLRRASPALGAAIIAAVGLLTSAVRVVPQRGGQWLTEGFHHGRWDARFLVARRPAAIRLPAVGLDVRLALSGPAALTLRGAGSEQRESLDSSPKKLRWSLPAGGRLELQADRPIRLHDLQLVRRGQTPWWRLAFILCLSLGAVLLAGLDSSRLGWAGSGCAAGLILLLLGDWGLLVLTVLLGRWVPAFVALGFCGALSLPWWLPTSRPVLRAKLVSLSERQSAAADSRLVLGMAGLALVSCLVQVVSLPQPLLIGDPAAYYDIGGRVLAALREVRGPDSLADALETLRPCCGLAFTGMLYGLLRAVYDDLHTVYVIQALAMAGAIGLLTRVAIRLGGRKTGIVAGVLALSYATFPVICGLVQPEPFTLLLWCAACDRLLAASATHSPRDFALAGLAFATGLALHPQGIWFQLAALALALAPFAGAMWRADRCRAVGACALGILPITLATAAGERYARPAVDVLAQRYGFWAYSAPYPLGFWLFIDQDGWQGPVRLNDTRYAQEMLARPSSASRLAGTVGFVTRNWRGSLRTVLRNLQRLWGRPDNPFRRAWLLPYSWQVPWHRLLLALFLLAVPIAVERRAAILYIPYVILSLTYPLYHIFNKYAVPATPFLLVGAALALVRLWTERPWRVVAGLGAAALGTALTPADLAWYGVPALLARAILLVLLWGGWLCACFFVGSSWARERTARWALACAAAAWLVPWLGAAWGDSSWRAFTVPLDREVEYEVMVDRAGQDRLDSAREAYLLLDLTAEDGTLADLRVQLGSGRVLTAADFEPCMPSSFGLATWRGGRDPRAFQQWWRCPWHRDMLSDGRLSLKISGSRRLRIAGDLGQPGAGGAYLGPSLGDWPNSSVYRLMYEDEYRLDLPRKLEGSGRVSRAGGHSLGGALRVRLVALDDDSGGATWETAVAAASTVVTGIWARAGRSAHADLTWPGGSLGLDFDRPARASGPAGEVRVALTGDYEGWYMIKTQATLGQPLRLTVRPRQEMSAVRKYFLPELRREVPPLPLDWAGIPYVPPVRILESREAPPWRVGVEY